MKKLLKKKQIDLYYALFYPNFIYGISIWGSTFKTSIEKLGKAQKRIIRAICGPGRTAPCHWVSPVSPKVIGSLQSLLKSLGFS